MKAVVTAFNQEKAPVGAFSVITNLRMDLYEALISIRVSVTAATYLCIVMYAVVDTHPWDSASKMMEASSRVSPVPPCSGRVYSAPNPSSAARRSTSTGNIWA